MLVTNSQYTVTEELSKGKKNSFFSKISRAIDYGMKMSRIAEVGMKNGDMKPSSVELAVCIEQIKNESL